MGNPYRDKEWLREKYVEQQLPMAEIADSAGCAVSTIHTWIEKHDLPKRSRSDSLRRAHGTDKGKYNDPEWLQREYVENKRSGLELAKECGVHVDTIYTRLEEHGIDRRDLQEASQESDWDGFDAREHPAWKGYVPMSSHSRDMYECWRDNYKGETKQVLVHRLLAVSEYGFDAVEGKHVHHKNGIRWDNRPENIEVLSQSEHTKLHHRQGDYPHSE